MQLTNSSAIVTGAASGLGRASAEALAAQGVKVYGIDLESAVHGLEPHPGIQYLAADITRSEEVAAAVLIASQERPLRVAVNCAGVAPSVRILGRHGVHDLALFAKVVSINLVGTFTVMALAAEAIAATEPDGNGQRGVIVNTASIAAYEGQIGQAAYAASKGGVAALTLPAARDLASSGIRVCTVAPGIVDTPMLASFAPDVRAALAEGVPFPKRLARPEEFAELMLSVIGHDYLNGETIRMDGALRMAPR